MSNLGKAIMALVAIVIVGFGAWLFEVDLQLVLLFSIAYDLTYMRIDKDYEQRH